MSVSRDEARELAIIGLLAVLALRIGAGVLMALDELTVASGLRNLLSRFFSQIGSTVGILTLGAVLLVVLSPRGSITTGLSNLVRRVAGAVAVLGAAGVVFTLSLGFSPGLARLWLAMINGLAAATLAGTGWWILANLDDER